MRNKIKYGILVVDWSGAARESDWEFPSINNAWQYCDNTDILKSSYVKMIVSKGKIVSSAYPFDYLIGKTETEAIDIIRNEIKRRV